jgi:hypothetical protein
MRSKRSHRLANPACLSISLRGRLPPGARPVEKVVEKEATTVANPAGLKDLFVPREEEECKSSALLNYPNNALNPRFMQVASPSLVTSTLTPTSTKIGSPCHLNQKFRWPPSSPLSHPQPLT